MRRKLELYGNLSLLNKTCYMLSILFLTSISKSNAQTNSSKDDHAISFEVGKTGLLYNLSYDYKVNHRGLRVVVGSNFSNKLSVFTTGVGAYFLSGKKNSFFEIGVDLNYLTVEEISDDQKGINLFYPDYTIQSYYASANIGFRKYSNNLMFRIGISPGFNKKEFLTGGYLSLGIFF